MATKAELVVRLFAGEVLVAETSDAALWQHVLAQITGVPASAPPAAQNQPSGSLPAGPARPATNPRNPADALGAFAQSLNVSREQVDSALSPTEEAPFIRIEPRVWAGFVRTMPERGPGAVPQIVVSATALCLWMRHLGRNEVPFDDAKAILAELGVIYKNPTRSINNCPWLQLRGENMLRLDPSNFPQGEAFLRAFVVGERPTQG